MSAFDRLSDLAKSKTEKVVGDVERNNPEAVYEAAVEGRLRSMAEHKDIAAALVVQRNRLSDKLGRAQSELEQLLVALKGALQEDDDDTALVLEYRRQEVMASVESQTAELVRVSDQVEETKRALNKLRVDTEALKREAIAAVAHKEVAEAQIEIYDTISGLADTASAKALSSVRDNVASLNRKAHPGYLDDEGNSIRGRAEAMGKKAAEERARAELEQMKAQLKGKPKKL